MLRILLADDHAIVRQGLKALLDSAGYRVVGEASDGRSAARLAKELKPDMMVLDIGMPLLNGIECANIVRRDLPCTQVVALTMHADDHYVLAALRAGIRGYVIKSHAMAELTDAIGKVARGSIYLSPEVSSSVLTGFLTGRETERHRLTPREREVLQLVAEGKRSKEIADVLDITVKTAETHRAHIMDKLAIRDTAGLVRYAIRTGLIMP